jgi:hypothetical protein
MTKTGSMHLFVSGQDKVISDDSNAQVAGEFGKLASKDHIKRMLTMPDSPWHNHAQASIKELKKATIRLMRKHHAPQRTWCYASKQPMWGMYS